MEIVSENLSFGGRQQVLRHASRTTGTEMTFSAYLPPAAEAGDVPCVIWLSGLTCTHENATAKAGFQGWAARLGLMVVCPDTSPRGDGVADDESYDLGQGAGFYVDATEAPWAPHFAMYSYVAEELPALLTAGFPVRGGGFGLFGHSMGGHGALTLGLRHPDLFHSVSAFAPIVAPCDCPWGRKALGAYLGPDEAVWAVHDATRLVRAGPHPGPILIDQGTADGFLDEQLRPHLFEAAALEAGQHLNLRMQEGYDHSYYFIASFAEDHLRHHAAALA